MIKLDFSKIDFKAFENITISVNDLRDIYFEISPVLKTYDDLNIFQKVLYKIRIKIYFWKLKKSFLKDFRKDVKQTLLREKLTLPDMSYND